MAGDAGRVRALDDFHGERSRRRSRESRSRSSASTGLPRRRARPCRRKRASGAPLRTAARRAFAPGAAGPAHDWNSLESLFAQLQEGAVEGLNLVLKGDVDGSVEVAISELSKIQHPEVRMSVIHSAVGGISENDVMLASASNAMVVGFNVRPNAEARSLAEREGVDGPHLPRHLPTHSGHRASACRHAEAGQRRADAGRGRSTGV